MKLAYTTPILAGVVCGMLSTFPIELRFLPSMILWGTAGIVVGFFTKEKKEILWFGVLYGFFLSIVFLYSRFGGTLDKVAAYSLLVLGLSVGGCAGGLLMVFIGSRFKKILRKTNK